MALQTKLCDRLGIRYPIVLAPMGLTSGGALAAAVSAAGGFGLIGGRFGDQPEAVEREFAAAGNQRVGCGFITWGLAQHPASLDLLLAHAPAAVLFSFGDAAPFIPKVKEAGIPVICQVQTVAMAREAVALGSDIVVAQGSEAGGHGSTRRGTLALVPAVVDAVEASGRDALVVAAGGIADGRGLAAALMLGADGVMMGTRFQAAEEALTSASKKAQLVGGKGDDTVRTQVFDIAREHPWPAEFSGRALANRFTENWHGKEMALRGDAEERTRYRDAEQAGMPDFAPTWAGEGIDLIHAVEPAGTIVARIAAEAEAALARRFD